MKSSFKYIYLLIASFSALFVLLVGCTQTTFIPPNSEQGKQCVLQCGGLREACRASTLSAQQTRYAVCQASADLAAQNCIRTAKTKEAVDQCQRNKPACFLDESAHQCQREYQQCFSHCGGQVVIECK